MSFETNDPSTLSDSSSYNQSNLRLKRVFTKAIRLISIDMTYNFGSLRRLAFLISMYHKVAYDSLAE